MEWWKIVIGVVVAIVLLPFGLRMLSLGMEAQGLIDPPRDEDEPSEETRKNGE